MKHFKIWHKPMKDFIEHEDIYSINLYAEIVTISDVDESGWGVSRSTDIPFSELEFLYSTGLKDKNGVAIYEGDIIQGAYNQYYDFARWKVYFADGCFTTDCVALHHKVDGFKDISRGGYSTFNLSQKTVSNLEVIGNIHQNPELEK